MDTYRDQTYLLKSQYKDATNFGARVDLHRRFRVNKYGFHRWVFDHFKLGEGSKLLELGCGPGGFWHSNRERVPASWQITLTDFSPGMLQDARKLLGEERFAYEIADAQKLPFADASFDAVIANHMLYHIPDLPEALGEIRRVLKPSGHFYATTFGRKHMRELDELVWKSWPNSPWKGLGESSPFILENGQEQLAPFFAQITLDTYEDALEVTETEPLAAYAFSLRLGALLTTEMRESFLNLIQQELAARGTIHITKASGMFVSHKT
ncbi:MAG TPA: class I SAM-dependent methyltransferase [Ktedonobacteraceae bacterium]|jgi:ubiquinone/menaquinone biosynthesis C-methylase UbiE|nr:class I SAM-dependent methyltransferase [Ktedonobacteraceae bacterium]